MRRSSTLHLVAYQGWRPEIMGTPAAARAAHALVGRLTLGGGAWLGAGAVIRADGHYVRIGAHAHFGRGATVHIAHDHYPTVVHERVSVGANAVVHACTVRADVVIEDDCVVLDGAQIGAGAVLEAASVVFPRSVLAGGMLYAGRPARALRALEPGEAAARAAALRARNEAADAAWPRGAPKAGGACGGGSGCTSAPLVRPCSSPVGIRKARSPWKPTTSASTAGWPSLRTSHTEPTGTRTPAASSTSPVTRTSVPLLGSGCASAA